MAYKHLFNCIHFGLYPTGSSLPTVPELCKTFNVSSSTIHNALRLLQEDHYVSLSQGRSAIVTYDVNEELCHQRCTSGLMRCDSDDLAGGDAAGSETVYG